MVTWILGEPNPVARALVRLAALQTNLERLAIDAPDLINVATRLECILHSDSDRFPGFSRGLCTPMVEVLAQAELHACQIDHFLYKVARRKTAFKTEIRLNLADTAMVYVGLNRIISSPSGQPYVLFNRDWTDSIARLCPS